MVIGGLGLGYTADAALEAGPVDDLTVVEFLAPVIEWHEAGILPLGTELAEDRRCRFVEGDFFAMAAGAGFDPGPARAPLRRDPWPISTMRPITCWTIAATVSTGPRGLIALKRHLKPGGVFGLWSDKVTDQRFLDRLHAAFPVAWAEPVTFDNPLTGRPFTQTVYLARAEGHDAPAGVSRSLARHGLPGLRGRGGAVP